MKTILSPKTKFIDTYQKNAQILLVFLNFIFLNILYGQTQYQGTIKFNSTSSKIIDIENTNDDSLVLCGQIQFTSSNILLIKADKNGKPIWNKCLGNPDGGFGHRVKSNSAGEIFIIGSSESTLFASNNGLVSKVSRNGKLEWAKIIGGNQWDELYDGIFDNSNLIVVGHTASYGFGGRDALAIKLDANGDTIWAKTYGKSNNESIYKIIKSKDNNFILCGTTMSIGQGGEDVLLIKINTNGDTIWTKSYGTPFSENGYAISEDIHGNLLVCGVSSQFPKGIFILKTNSTGALQWTKHYQPTSGYISADENINLYKGSNNNLYSSFYSANILGGGGNNDAILAEFDTAGMVNWIKGFGGNQYDDFKDVIERPSGYLAFGQTANFNAPLGNTTTFKIFTDSIGQTGCNEYIPSINIQNLNFSQSSKLDVKSGIKILNYSPSFEEVIAIDSIFCGKICTADTSLNNLSASICSGSSFDLSMFKKTNTTSGYWNVINPFPNAPSIFGDSFLTTSLTPAGNYSIEYKLTPTPQTGCPATVKRIIKVNSNPIISLTNKEICFGSSTTFDAGLGYDSYQWSDLGSGNTQFISASIEGKYSVIVTNSENCSDSSSALLKILPVTNPPLIKDQSICYGESAIFDAGSGYYSYLWRDLATGNNQSVTASIMGNYTVTVRDTNNCEVSKTVKLTVNPLPHKPDLDNQTICEGDTTYFNAGAGYHSYVWGNLGEGNNQSTKAYISGSYSIEVRDSNNCFNQTSAQLNIIKAFVNILDTNICSSDFATLKVSPNNIKNEWNGPNGFSSSMNEIIANTPGKYFVSIKDQNGCIAHDSAVIKEFNDNNSQKQNIEICENETTKINMGHFINYIWTGPNNFNSNLHSPILKDQGIYFLEAIDSNKCSVKDTIEFTINHATQFSLGIDSSTCFAEGNSIFLKISNEFNSIEWNTGITDSSINVTTPGKYYVAVTNNKLCKSNDTIIISEKCNPTKLCFPNIITPNNDGFNDFFTFCKPIPEEKIKKINLQFFDRWGVLMHESNEKNILWDGKFQNNAVSPGVYYYIAKYTDSTNSNYTETGWLQIIQ